jgi:hypothetical protein
MTHPVIRRRLFARRVQYCLLPTPKEHSGHLGKNGNEDSSDLQND